ncbi:FkbM family methyltransferase [Anthocerotibacter panamensis]|uniref:FkbM family methyltransferase n=1 Tax=Anthocerotibacter panamensis TaxID=2857077 RepID=UPI001C403A60|nr:FkbM family methyltransferase [Anthocerotibacter panamensis]
MAILRKYEILGTEVEVWEQEGSMAADIVASELSQDSYQLASVPFSRGDCVIDIGGHIGLFSIVLAKIYPDLKIYAFEPFPANYECFRKNIVHNRVMNVSLYNLAVTKDGRNLSMVTNPNNSGGATAYSTIHTHLKTDNIPSISLEKIFEQNSIEHCKLLKIDCEGAEYEILLNCTILDKIDYLAAEFHINKVLLRYGYSSQDLFEHCARFFKAENMAVTGKDFPICIE